MTDIQCDCTPPEGLSEAAGAVWHEIHDTYAMGISDIETLNLAVRALDRARLASTEVETDGPVVLDRFGQRKSHPGVEVATTQSKLYDLLIASLDLRNRRLRKDCQPCLA